MFPKGAFAPRYFTGHYWQRPAAVLPPVESGGRSRMRAGVRPTITVNDDEDALILALLGRGLR